MLEKWKRAVVHLECATDSEYFHDRIRRFDELRALFDQGKVTHEQLIKEMSGGSRDVRYHGTALFLSHAGRRYLLTARHVVWDEMSAHRELEEERKQVLSFPESERAEMLHSAEERAQNCIFKIIFRVPTIDEVLAGQGAPEYLMNLGAGVFASLPYVFSDPELDLALISLDQGHSGFADGLVSRGFVPLESSDIADGPDGEGQEVFAIGFPSATALLGSVDQQLAVANWSSCHYSLPVSSFGRVSMLHAALPYYWADMSIYPGNSGGPVVANDRLVGVVSAQATLPIDDVPEVRTRIPFGKIIKTSFARVLLEIQARKGGLG